MFVIFSSITFHHEILCKQIIVITILLLLIHFFSTFDTGIVGTDKTEIVVLTDQMLKFERQTREYQSKV